MKLTSGISEKFSNSPVESTLTGWSSARSVIKTRALGKVFQVILKTNTMILQLNYTVQCTVCFTDLDFCSVMTIFEASSYFLGILSCSEIWLKPKIESPQANIRSLPKSVKHTVGPSGPYYSKESHSTNITRIPKLHQICSL